LSVSPDLFWQRFTSGNYPYVVVPIGADNQQNHAAFNFTQMLPSFFAINFRQIAGRENVGIVKDLTGKLKAYFVLI
jgi:hypothetical protein